MTETPALDAEVAGPGGAMLSERSPLRLVLLLGALTCFGLAQYAIGCVLAPLTGLDGQTSFAWVIAASALTGAAVHAVLLHKAS